MKLILEATTQVWRIDEMVTVRLMVLNESYEPLVVDRRLLVGPNLTYSVPKMSPPIQIEPGFTVAEQNQITLNPWCFYGRQRTFSGIPLGQVTLYGYYLQWPEDALLPKGPVNPAALLVEAEPLVLTIVDKT